MLAKLLSRLVQPTSGRAHDHLFSPFAPNGASPAMLGAIYHQYANAYADEMVPPQHVQYRALIHAILGEDALGIDDLRGETLRRVRSAYVTCFERFDPYMAQLALWGRDAAFRTGLSEAREGVVDGLIPMKAAEDKRRAHYSRWKECLASPIDLQGATLIDLIRQMGPDDWHEIVLRWNWDHGVTELDWITSRRDCDRATAVLALCDGYPGHVARHKPSRYEQGAWDYSGFVRTLACRLEGGFYPKAEIALDLSMRTRVAYERELEAARATDESPWRLPDELLDQPGIRKHAPRYAITDGQLHYHYEYWLAHVADR
jgi:hypothetical protein